MAISAAERQTLELARDNGLDQNLHAIAVKATLVDGVNAETDEALLEPCVLLEVVPDPVLDILLRSRGATARGRMSWTVGLGEDANTAPLRTLATTLAPGLLWPHEDTYTTRGPKDLCETAYANKFHKLQTLFRGTPAVGVFEATVAARVNTAQPRTAAGYGAITISSDGRVAWMRAITHKFEVPAHLPQIVLNQRHAGKSSKLEISPVLAVQAIPVLEWLIGQGVTVLDETGFVKVLRRRLAETVVAHPKPGQPAMAQVSVGRKVRMFLPTLNAPEPADGEAISLTETSAVAVATALEAAPVVESVLHEGVADVCRMAVAAPFADESLWEYQREAVGRHLSTKLGYLNACSPGLGKTVMALVPMRERAKTIGSYRGLVVAEANVRAQWTSEAAKWFPAAKLVTITASKDTGKLIDALAAARTDPLVVITSYAMLHSVVTEMAARSEVNLSSGSAETVEDDGDQMGLFSLNTILSDEDLQAVVVHQSHSTGTPRAQAQTPVEEKNLGMVLLDTHFHDVIADEAEVLRGTGKQAAALWEIRRNADVAVALTGTPINRGLDDLGRLLSWVRKDERLFRGVKLSDQFELADPAEAVRFAEAMGPVLFRRDTSEVAADLPTVSSTVMKLLPSSAEKALADAARLELRRVYTELLAAIETAEELDPENAAFAAARQELTKARGAWLGGTQLARMAASDPASLLGSNSAGAALLTGQGLVAAATQQTGTKRLAVITDVVERVASGEAVIVFTEFATVARGLIDDLDAAGVKVGSVLGGGGTKRDRMVKEFQDGELDVLVATSSGERGLNLQRANTIVHYDLPWTPKGVIQRTGRARRLKSENQHLTVVFPLMVGTVEEKVASMVVSRALDSMRALDTSRGVESSATEMGLALGGLAQAVSETRAGRSEGAQLMEITQALVS